ncbi:efflux RND transporter periplasmic adaptor subunit, partial [Chitinimonas sp.]|uniref:efflux RND transporter periplasmic adaptor subunit n=1 Tax=Chitinimonas sp. TaxID=1934313 RepID=UPI0035ADC0C6
MPHGPALMKVQVVQLQASSDAAPQLLFGRIVARRPALLFAAQDGLRVEKVLVEPGQTVTAGQALIELDRRGLLLEQQQAGQTAQRAAAQHAAAQAQLAQVEARLAAIADEARRYGSVADSGAVSDSELIARQAQLKQGERERDAARQSVLAAQAEQAAAQAQAALAQQRASDAVLRAPIAGVVSERRAEQGMLTDRASGPLLRIAAANDREFEASIDPSQAQWLRGASSIRAQVQIDGQTAVGTIRAVDDSMGEQSRRGVLRISLDAAKPLPLGRAATAMLAGSGQPGIALPASAIQFDPAPWVLVADAKGKLEKRPVQLIGSGTLASGGVKAGEQVVLNMAALLSPGQIIEPVLAGNAPPSHSKGAKP